ncbi:MAG: YmdB family metallophosphoesterase [Oscillospiraceae bacterium]|nr:YmdB family metallophosphoesterase [Oscillospiraceae bacterium]
MKILFIGDVVGRGASEALCGFLPSFKRELELGKGLVIVNGENSADGNGISPNSANLLFDAGADVITTGNHCFKRRDMDDMYRENSFVLRPANYGSDAPGRGVCIIDRGNFSAAVINLAGIMFMTPADNPFNCVDTILKDIETRNIIVDFHAEATAEKKAMGYYLSGRVSAVLGSHTHIQTADEQIMDTHTAYITDVGMTGPHDSVLGVEKDIIIKRFLCYYPQKYILAEGTHDINAVLIEIDEKSGKAKSIVRISKTM